MKQAMIDIRDHLAIVYSEKINCHPSNSTVDYENSIYDFKVGFDCRDKLDNKLELKLKIAIQALEFYGDKVNWSDYGTLVLEDSGLNAIEALAAINEEYDE